MSEQKRLIGILRYLEDWDKLSRTSIGSVRDYRAGFVAFQERVGACPDIDLNVKRGDEDDIWMAIPRLSKKAPPPVAETLDRWVAVQDDPESEPRREEFLELPAEEPEDEPIRVNFGDDESRKIQYESYLRDEWKPWSERERERRRCIGVYEEVFHLQQTIENSGAETPIELVWGMGVAAWSKSGHRVDHPLITQQVEILPLEGDMTLRVRPTSRDPQLELDPFLPMELAELPQYERSARKTLDDSGGSPSPFESKSFESLAKSAAASLDTAGRYWPEEEDYVPGVSPKPGAHLIVTDSWVLFARKRNTNFLVEDLKRLQEAIEEEGVPEGASHFLVEEPTGVLPEPEPIAFRGLSTAGMSTEAIPSEELFFPKPFNQEQVEIIERLESSPGVVVQGPPGTGKTHTIANVICHYLASGKRVLVTSKGETALSVLQQQIPESIRELSVSLLTNERDGKAQLERTVNRIVGKLTTLSSSDLKSKIQRDEEGIERLHQSISAIDSDLREWARKNTSVVPSHLGDWKPEALARRVAAAASDHAWFPDELDDRPEHEPQFSDEEMAALTAARLGLGEVLVYVDTNLPVPEDLPSGSDMALVQECLCEQDSLSAEIQEVGLSRLSADDAQSLDAARRLHLEVQAHQKLISQCEEPWLAALRVSYRESAMTGERSAIVSILDELLEEVVALDDKLSQFAAIAIEVTEGCETDEKLIAAIDRAVEGKRPFAFFAIGMKQTKEIFGCILINSFSPSSPEEWQQVREYLSLVSDSRSLLTRWDKMRSQFDAPGVEGTPEAAVSSVRLIAKSMEAAKELGAIYDLTLSERVSVVFQQIPASEILPTEEFLGHIDRSIDVQLRHRQLAASNSTVKKLQSITEGCSGELFDRISEWRTQCLGKSQYSANHVGDAWGGFVGEITKLHLQSEDFAIVRRVTDLIAQSGATQWAKRLREQTAVDERDVAVPENWKASWLWSRQRGYLRAIDGRADVLNLAAKRRDAELELRRSYEAVTEQRTWLRLVEQLRLDRAISRGITAYVQAIRGMTKSGKGKRDGKLRHAAREAMQLASRGVPCWIMPHWRVSESLPARLGDFDLVVVDEASQSDAWAVPSIIRGKKILIVGDDKQVGPQPSFTRQEQIDQIQERLKMEGVPLDILNRLDPKESIYDLGELVFSGQTIRLREHFRCAEPIIEFSNKLCYDGEIKCVRVPNAQERLLPTLVDVHIKTGRRDKGKKVNKPEATAIVEEIAALINDEDFAGRSIGVVSMLGPDQAKFIFDQLLEVVGEEAFLKYHIRCGDARTFQGSEADVIFLTCVDDGSSGTVMTSNKVDNIRRINVAVSRARDRLYLFHSFARGDLGENDLRARLIDHFKTPMQGLSEKQGIELCESEFERQMFIGLTDRGYRVIPQVPVGNYRIDFVVEGHNGKRLAVECDGDRYHGPDKWMEDAGRQRVLERAGWKFWRCWGSSFIRDEAACFEDLTATLKLEGIDPIGADDVDFSGLVQFREIGPEFEPESEAEPSSLTELNDENSAVAASLQHEVQN